MTTHIFKEGEITDSNPFITAGDAVILKTYLYGDVRSIAVRYVGAEVDKCYGGVHAVIPINCTRSDKCALLYYNCPRVRRKPEHESPCILWGKSITLIPEPDMEDI